MNRICNILVFVDPTASAHPSVQKAALLAAKLNARLELYVCDTRAARETRLMRSHAKDPQRAMTLALKPMLEELARPLREAGIDVCTDCEYADVLREGLLDRAKRTSADLIVKDTHHHSIAQRTILTNTDWELIRASPIPLLLVRPRPWPASPCILAAVDPRRVNDKPESLDDDILDYATLLSRRLQGVVHAGHAYVPLAVAAAIDSGITPIAMPSDSGSSELQAKEERRRMSALTDRCDIPPERTHVEVGVASEVLPALSLQIDADILVLGAVSRRGLAKIFIGSTAEHVLERMPCDVLVVKPPDFASALPFP